MSSKEKGNVGFKTMRPRLALAVICILAVLLIALIVLAAGVGAVRTVVISAETSSLEVQFSGEADYWDLGLATICTPLEKLNRSAKRGASICDPRRYEQSKEQVSLIWKDGNKAVLSMANDDLEIQIIDASSHKSGTKIHLAPKALSKLGALSFSGFVSLGQVAASGETRLMRSGIYDIREKPFLANATETIKSGEFRPGEKVGVYQNSDGAPKQVRVYGYILQQNGDARSFRVSLISESGPSNIRVNYFGGQVPIEIAPNWIDRSITSPLILALSILVPIILTIAQLFLTASSGISGASISSAIRYLRKSISR